MRSIHRRARWLTSLALLLGSCGPAPSTADAAPAEPVMPSESDALAANDALAEADAEEHRQRALELIADLDALGFPIDAERLRFEVRDQSDCRDDLTRQQALFFPGTFFTGYHQWLTALGLADTSPEGLLEREVAAMSQSFSAYYQPDRQALVFPRTHLNQLTEALGQRDHIVTHELVHASQDQRPGGLAELLSAGRRSREAASIAQVLMEGEAEVAALERALVAQGLTLDAVSQDDLDVSAALEQALGNTALIYQVGRRLVLATVQRDGWDGLARLRAQRPSSTEQLLHPEKDGVDLPVSVPPIDWRALWPGAELVHEDTYGELILRQLLSSTVDAGASFRAASGWDGDHLLVLRLPSGELLAHWRSVWDREQDAQQFVDAIVDAGGRAPRVSGRVLDAVAGPDAEVARLLQALPAWTAAADPADGVSTAAAEEAHRAPAGRREGDLWLREDIGLSVVIPDGWVAESANGMPILRATGSDLSFRDNITAMRLPNPLGTDTAAHLSANRSQFEAMPHADLTSLDEAQVAGRPGLAYAVRLPVGPGQELVIDGRIALFESEQVVVTATCSAARADELADDVQAILASLAWLDDD